MSSFFGREIPLAEAFDDFSKFQIEVTSSDAIWGSNEMTHTYNKNNLPTKEYIPCSNKLCKRGGFSLIKLLDQMHSKEADSTYGSFRCNGDEGSAQGRKIGKSCTYKFDYEISWEK